MAARVCCPPVGCGQLRHLSTRSPMPPASPVRGQIHGGPSATHAVAIQCPFHVAPSLSSPPIRSSMPHALLLSQCPPMLRLQALTTGRSNMWVPGSLPMHTGVLGGPSLPWTSAPWVEPADKGCRRQAGLTAACKARPVRAGAPVLACAWASSVTLCGAERGNTGKGRGCWKSVALQGVCFPVRLSIKEDGVSFAACPHPFFTEQV